MISIIFKKMFKIFICISILPVFLCISYMCLAFIEASESAKKSGTKIIGSCELSEWVLGNEPRSSAIAANARLLSFSLVPKFLPGFDWLVI